MSMNWDKTFTKLICDRCHHKDMNKCFIKSKEKEDCLKLHCNSPMCDNTHQYFGVKNLNGRSSEKATRSKGVANNKRIEVSQ